MVMYGKGVIVPPDCFSASTVFVPLAAHAPITAHQSYFQFELYGIINRPLKSSYSQWVPITYQRYINT